MNAGDIVMTPRFCKVRIEKIFDTKEEMERSGYTEPTYYDGLFEVRGRVLDVNSMVFAACERKE